MQFAHDHLAPRRSLDQDCMAASQSGGVRLSGQYAAQLANSNEFSDRVGPALAASPHGASGSNSSSHTPHPGDGRGEGIHGATAGDSPEDARNNPPTTGSGQLRTTGGSQPARPASSDDRAARFARALAAGMIEAGLLALAAALLITASPTTTIELVTQPPVTGR